VAFVLAGGATVSGPAAADPRVTERTTEVHGATTVTWDSGFQDPSYALGEPIALEVRWTVEEGVATFRAFSLRGSTPAGPDPAIATEPDVTSRGPGSVEARFTFTDLHLDRERGVSIGNAHLALTLEVDTDGDEDVDTAVDLGVNVHVEDQSGTTGPTGPAGSEVPADLDVPAIPDWGPARRASGPNVTVPAHEAAARTVAERADEGPPPVARAMREWATCVGDLAAGHEPGTPFDP
jgi:hypothetical protein